MCSRNIKLNDLDESNEGLAPQKLNQWIPYKEICCSAEWL